MSQPTIVLGLGNPLMGDDGAGLAALEVLRDRWSFGADVSLEDGGTLGLGLLPLVEDAGAVLVLDAVRLGGQLGAIVVLQAEDIPRCLTLKLSPHQAGLLDTLALAALRGRLPARLALVGVEVAETQYAQPLSATVERALSGMVAAAVAQLRAWGVTFSSRATGSASRPHGPSAGGGTGITRKQAPKSSRPAQRSQPFLTGAQSNSTKN